MMPHRNTLSSRRPKSPTSLYLSAAGFALIALSSTLLGISYLVCPSGVSPPLTRPNIQLITLITMHRLGG